MIMNNLTTMIMGITETMGIMGIMKIMRITETMGIMEIMGIMRIM
jgi:hypothetical protein